MHSLPWPSTTSSPFPWLMAWSLSSQQSAAAERFAVHTSWKKWGKCLRYSTILCCSFHHGMKSFEKLKLDSNTGIIWCYPSLARHHYCYYINCGAMKIVKTCLTSSCFLSEQSSRRFKPILGLQSILLYVYLQCFQHASIETNGVKGKRKHQSNPKCLKQGS